MVGDVISVHAGVQLESADAGLGEPVDDLERIVVLRAHLPEADEAIGVGILHPDDDVVLDPLREGADHRHVDAGRVHRGEDAARIQRDVGGRLLPGRAPVR